MTKEDIIKEYNIDLAKLQRNYIEQPLKKGKWRSEKPYKKDLIYLYITNNINKTDLSIFFGFKSIKPINNWLSFYKIQKSKELLKFSIKHSLQKKIQADPDYQKKKLQKRIQTCRKKYGVDNIFQSEEKKIKAKQTLIYKYGIDNPSKSEKIKQKKEQTCLEHFGVTNPSYSEQFKNLWKNEEFIKKVKEKEYLTKIQNDSFKVSKEENKIFEMLLSKYHNVKRQYKSDLYPFNCDFYIPSLDLYIEYQGNWTHGFYPFDYTNKECIKKLEFWKQKSAEKNFKNSRKNYYLNAIQVWTKRDPLKRETAKKNNLNWIEFFTMDQFMKWYNKY